MYNSLELTPILYRLLLKSVLFFYYLLSSHFIQFLIYFYLLLVNLPYNNINLFFYFSLLFKPCIPLCFFHSPPCSYSIDFCLSVISFFLSLSKPNYFSFLFISDSPIKKNLIFVNLKNCITIIRLSTPLPFKLFPNCMHKFFLLRPSPIKSYLICCWLLFNFH